MTTALMVPPSNLTTTLAKPRARPGIACACAKGKDASQPISSKHVNPRENICELEARLIRTTVPSVGSFIAQVRIVPCGCNNTLTTAYVCV